MPMTASRTAAIDTGNTGAPAGLEADWVVGWAKTRTKGRRGSSYASQPSGGNSSMFAATPGGPAASGVRGRQDRAPGARS